jgi:hypothetical protein
VEKCRFGSNEETDMTIAKNGTHPDLVVAFHMYASDVGYDLRGAAQALELIRNLGGNGVRFELSWFDIEPEKNVWDKGKIAWYKDFFHESVDSFAITPIVNLTGLPRWAERLLRRDRRAFVHRWRLYCERAVEIMDGHVPFIQVWNEPNNPILQIFEPAHAHVGIFHHDFFHELLNLTAAQLRPAIQPLEILINVTSDLPRWEQFVNECIRHADGAFDIIGLDAYPGTYIPMNWREFPSLMRLLHRVNDPHDLWFGKQAALIEFGYSTFLPPLRSEAKQLEWANAVLSLLRRENLALRKRDAKSLRLVSWYELYDQSNQLSLNFLNHFGIVHLPNSHTHPQRKLAFDILQRHFRALRENA